ncbi:MAG: hypothetical protein IKQ10_10175 [Oscillospiraceae bacterium]|nr:hypothetical protein [Oscillospiraceae bacterium]
MIKKQFTASARRARNIIWNAAGRYDFEPPFMAFFPNGAPDHYFNMVVGLVEKWLEMPRIWAFFESYGTDRRAEEFDEFLWLGLENCVYEKEVGERPILAKLRRDRAERFSVQQGMLSRQQMEYQSMPVYTQQEARWAEVLGKNAPLLTPREKRMAQALKFPGSLDTDGVLAAMAAFLKTFFRFEPSGEETPLRRGGALSRLLLRHEHRRRDRLLVRTGTGEGDHPRAVHLGHDGLGRHTAPTEEDEAYIRAVFGRSVISDAERRVLENDLCVDADADCRVWVTAGEGVDTAHREAADVRESSLLQRERNQAFLTENAAALQHTIKALATRMETVLSSYLRHLPEPSRAGQICPEKAYRLPILQDSRVFLKSGEEIEQEIFVDLLLDASQSRRNMQETLSAEAYVVAKSLMALHFPVRVSTFRSIRGYTVLDVLKSASQTDCRGVTRFYAGGWNRDSLALRLLGHMDDDPVMRGKQRILLIMTDASPNDSTPIAAMDRWLPREYEGAAAVKLTEDAVRSLRAWGIRVGAVFHGNSIHMEDLNQIYNHAYVRIRKATQLAQGISDLLLLLLREMRND